jgi:hypothetical protein
MIRSGYTWRPFMLQQTVYCMIDVSVCDPAKPLIQILSVGRYEVMYGLYILQGQRAYHDAFIHLPYLCHLRSKFQYLVNVYI